MSGNWKVAIVTGGASGLGAAMAEELAARGAHVVISDINLEAAQNKAAELGPNCEAARLDTSNAEEVNALVMRVKEKYGSLDLIFNCAGTSCYGEILDLPAADWERVLKVNLWGVIHGSLAAYKIMAAQGHGTIINMGSMTAFQCDPMFAPYTTSKWGVVGFSRVLGIEAEAMGVQVSVICPGNIRTPMLGLQEPSKFNPAVPAREASRRILDAAARGKKIVVFPLYAKLVWWLDRLSPSLLNPLRREIIRRARLRNKKAAATGA